MNATFVVVTVELRDRALITDGPAVSPRTLDHLPGPAVRGMLAAACTAEEIEVLIAGGDLWSAPGLPVMSTPAPYDPSRHLPVVAYPTARTSLIASEDGLDSVVDARTVRTDDPDVRYVSAPTLTVSVPDPDTTDVLSQPAIPPTSTHQRLHRSRIAGAAPGPFTETVLEPGTSFRIRFRIPDHVPDPDVVVDTLVEVLDRPGLRIGSGAHGAYGGDLTVLTSPERSNRPWDVASPDTAAGVPVHLVLVTPAVIRHPHTGEHDPSALPGVLAGSLTDTLSAAAGDRVQVTVTGPPPSVGAVRVGGFHRGYRGLRPEHWAAAAGSVVTVTTDVPVAGRIWDRAVSERVGERCVDGFGLLRIDSTPTLWEGVAAPVYTGADRTAVRLADGAAAPESDFTDPQVHLLRHNIFRTGSEISVADLAMLLARNTLNPPRNHTLSRIREVLRSASWDREAAAADLAAVRTLLSSWASSTEDADLRPAAEAVSGCRISLGGNNSWTLQQWLLDITDLDYDPTTSILRWTADPLTFPAAALSLPSRLGGYSLATATPAQDIAGDVASWIDNHHVELRHALAGTLLHALRTGKDRP